MDVISMSTGRHSGSRSIGGCDCLGPCRESRHHRGAAGGNAGRPPYLNGDPSASPMPSVSRRWTARAFTWERVHIALSSGGGLSPASRPTTSSCRRGNVPAVILKQRQCPDAWLHARTTLRASPRALSYRVRGYLSLTRSSPMRRVRSVLRRDSASSITRLIL